MHLLVLLSHHEQQVPWEMFVPASALETGSTAPTAETVGDRLPEAFEQC